MSEVIQYKSRCHSLGRIMGGTMGLSASQSDKLFKLNLRHTDPTAKPLTANMLLEYKKLVDLRNNPTLPQGAKTAVQSWYKSQLYKRRKEVHTKEMAKGIYMEQWSIDFLSKLRGTMYLKNEERFENDWLTGTPDIKTPRIITDIKNSWDAFTFPLFETELPNMDYDWQLQGYMWLTGAQSGEVVYVLANAPEYLIDQAANREKYTMDIPEVTEQLWDKHYKAMTFDDVPDHLRVKVFKVERDEAKIEQIKERVEACRVYLETIKIKS